MWVQFNYSGEVDIPFDTLKQNPELILRKLPRVNSITRMDEDDFRVVLKPYALHKALVITAVGHVNLSVVGDSIVWSESPHHSNTECNGKIVGTATRNQTGAVRIEGTIHLNHPWINSFIWPFTKPIVEALGIQFINEFVDNFRNEDYNNRIPEVVQNGN